MVCYGGPKPLRPGQARAFASAVWDAEKQLLLVYGGAMGRISLIEGVTLGYKAAGHV